MERRLAAILAADVVGYSRLMGADEVGTLERLKSLRRELVQPGITERGGRIVKLMGDGLLAEFPNAVEAVQCAIEIQHTMGERNADIPKDRRIRRQSNNLQTVVHEDESMARLGRHGLDRLRVWSRFCARPGCRWTGRMRHHLPL